MELNFTTEVKRELTIKGILAYGAWNTSKTSDYKNKDSRNGLF